MEFLSSPGHSAVSRYDSPDVVVLRVKDFIPSETPLRDSSTFGSFAYAHTGTVSPGLWSVQFIGTMWTIGAGFHWDLNR